MAAKHLCQPTQRPCPLVPVSKPPAAPDLVVAGVEKPYRASLASIRHSPLSSPPTNRRLAMPGNREAAVGGGADRLSDLPDGILELVLSFLPAADAVRTSVLSRRFRGAWAHAPALNLSDGLLQGRFLGFAREALARYGAPDIPALHVTIGCECNLGPATAAWLRDAMERAVESVSVTVTAPGALHCLTLPRCLRAKSIALRLSGSLIFEHGPLVLPESGAPSSFGGLTELSLSKVRLQEHVRPLGVFLSSCCPRLRKLRLSKVCGGLTEDGELTLWQFVLRLDLLEELEVHRVETFTKLQVVSSNLRTLAVLSCFKTCLQWGMDTVVEITAPRLEDVSWSGLLPKHLSFLNGSHCIRRLSGPCFFLPGKELLSASAVRLLEICSRADHLSVRIDIPDSTSLAMLTREELEHVPHLPNVRALSVQMFAVLRFIRCPIAPVILSFLKQCPNLTRLHIDLSMLHQFSRLIVRPFVVPFKDETEEKPWQSTDCGMWKTWRDQQQLGSLQEIRLSGFMGTDHEMEVADLLFGVWASRPALERISISLFPQSKQGVDGSHACKVGIWSNFEGMHVSFARVLQHIDGIGAKMKAEFPRVEGCWETVPRKEITWTRT